MTTTTIRQEVSVQTKDEVVVTTGPASAAMIASGIGTFVIGLMTTLAEASEGIKEALNWWNPAGPLVGKTGVAVIVWLISWALLHNVWKTKEYEIGKAFKITMFFIILGLLLTFPPIFTLFAAE